MSDGNGKDSSKLLSERESQQWNKKSKKKRSGDDEFAQAIARIAAAQVCESLGFQSFHQSALDTLADVGVRYIKEIGKTATYCANSANRSQCNVFDVIQGLEDLGSVQGFSCASDVNHYLSGSGVVKDLIRYVNKSDEIPFAYLIPAFPVVKERVALNHSFARVGENRAGEHIPSWLPKFPDPETYLDLTPGNTKDKEPVDEESPRRPGRPLLNFQQKKSNGSEGGMVEQGEERNPFLAPPLQYGEKEVSLPVIPTKLLDEVADYRKSSEALEPSLRPGVSVGHEKDPLDPEDRRNIILNGRPGVQFKFRIKRFLERSEKVSVWFDEDCDAKEVMKGKAEKILSEDDGVLPEVMKGKAEKILSKNDGLLPEVSHL